MKKISITLAAALLAACTPTAAPTEDTQSSSVSSVQAVSSVSSVTVSSTAVSSVMQEAVSSTASTPSGITMAEVQVHNSKGSCYTVVDGSVYDVTSFISLHPGGEAKILKVCGRDGTSLFFGEREHTAEAQAELAKHKIGILAQ